MTDAQVALEAASRIHQKVQGDYADATRSVTSTANVLLQWLKDNS